jgi:hypothetical protein
VLSSWRRTGEAGGDSYALTSTMRRRKKRRSWSVCASSRARSYSVRAGALVCSAKAAEQVGTCRVEVLVAVEAEAVDEGEPRFGSFRLGHANRAVQLHDR